MKKKLCTMAVSLMVGLSLVACGGNAKQAETGRSLRQEQRRQRKKEAILLRRLRM